MESKLIKFFVYFFSLLTFGSLFFIIGFILLNGIPNLNLAMFSWNYTTTNVSMMPSIITTLALVLSSLVIAAPIGVFTAFYLVEYADKNNKFVDIIRIATDTLSGIPSIVYGLFGMLFFVVFLGFQYSLLSGILTSVIMVLPVIIRSTEEALLSVKDALREGSLALGAGKLRTIFRVVLPVAMPGILSGLILGVGRIVGETAALMYTLGTSTNLPHNFMQSGRTLALHMFVLSSEGMHVNESYATGVVLIIVVLIINSLSTLLSNRLTKGAK
ncbi:phosphate transport system permease protein psta [Trichococcus palustris]|jgi:phosphate transport system permease protein|uniref:Phosphate transport system permease protein PstA n=1 Tax=Trichococcus palustris TaxID=140314 RepID=A0A143YJA8_9LACT|nr:phosphate ABC transporter permease PstA [Trichococcus palustris]CZQ91344.1 phosphate transport system permease protein psta [Trichococcus palustris]SFL02228.1 phosphate transport system permease protein [Trichococcus palustris]